MKAIAITLALAGAAACALALPQAAGAAPPCAVVELFTSEGCSSCPPAEALLTRLDAHARAAGQRVYLLEFHVDYWNSLGWRDPWSSAAASERQHAYAAQLGIDQVYTPQMIVGGTSEFVGSNADRAEREIATALARPSAVDVALAAAPGDRVRIRLTPVPKGALVLVARVDDPPASHVAKGENAGRVLRHSDVVRAFATTAPDAKGLAEVTLGAGPGRIVALVQDRGSGAVLGAAATAR